MSEVVFIDQRGRYHAFDNFMIPARNIKFIHIPEKVNKKHVICDKNLILDHKICLTCV